jgi:6-phosphogluconolactonase (cycloisomerase 2 family)
MRPRIGLGLALFAIIFLVACGAGTDCSTSKSVAGGTGGSSGGTSRVGSGGCANAPASNPGDKGGGTNFQPSGPFCSGRAGDSHFLYVGDVLTGNLDTFALADTGQAEFLCHSAKVDLDITSVAVVNNTFLYAYSSADAHLWAFTMNGPVLAPVTGSPFTVGTKWLLGSVFPLAVDPAASFLFQGDFAPGQITALAIGNGGAVSPVAGTPVADGSASIDLAVHPTGRFLYSFHGNNISQFAIDTSGALTPLTPATVPYDVLNTATTGGAVTRIVVEPHGNFLYVLAERSISFYSVHPTTGVLTFVSSVLPVSLHTNPMPADVAIDPTGKFLYVGDTGSNTALPGWIDAFAIDQVNGSLTPIPGQPFLSDQGDPFHLVIDPEGAHVWIVVGSQGQSRIFGLAIDPTTGVLTNLTQSPTGLSFAANSPIAIAVTASFGR